MIWDWNVVLLVASLQIGSKKVQLHTCACAARVFAGGLRKLLGKRQNRACVCVCEREIYTDVPLRLMPSRRAAYQARTPEWRRTYISHTLPGSRFRICHLRLLAQAGLRGSAGAAQTGVSTAFARSVVRPHRHVSPRSSRAPPLPALFVASRLSTVHLPLPLVDATVLPQHSASSRAHCVTVCH